MARHTYLCHILRSLERKGTRKLTQLSAKTLETKINVSYFGQYVSQYPYFSLIFLVAQRLSLIGRNAELQIKLTALQLILNKH